VSGSGEFGSVRRGTVPPLQYVPKPTRGRGLSPISVIFLLGVGVLALYNSLGPRELPGQRLGYAAMVGGVAVALLVRGADMRLSAGTRTWLVTSVLLLGLGMAGVITQAVVYPTYIIGDLASLGFPLLLFLAGTAEPRLLRNPRLHLSLGLVLAAAAFLAVNFPDRSGRFEPPSTFLVSLVCVWGILGQRGTRRAVMFGILGLLFVVAFASEVRTAPVLILLALTLTYVLAGANPRTILTGVMLLGAGAVAVQSSSAVRSAERFLLETRFKRLVTGEVDESLLTRLQEARDVLRTAEREFTPLNVVLGAGHGATYQPYESLVERNLTAEGRVHNIHHGPALMGFRYGVVGLIALLGLWVLVAQSLIRLWRAGSPGVVSTRVHAIFTVSLILFLIDFTLRNVITDPLFSYSLAGFLLTRGDAPSGETRTQPVAH
jgi:hypothetical protein